MGGVHFGSHTCRPAVGCGRQGDRDVGQIHPDLPKTGSRESAERTAGVFWGGQKETGEKKISLKPPSPCRVLSSWLRGIWTWVGAIGASSGRSGKGREDVPTRASLPPRGCAASARFLGLQNLPHWLFRGSSWPPSAPGRTNLAPFHPSEASVQGRPHFAPPLPLLKRSLLAYKSFRLWRNLAKMSAESCLRGGGVHRPLTMTV